MAPDAECVGPPDAKRGLVYLHGIDAVQMTDQEKGNRALLTRIASEEKVRIALLRAKTKCGPGQFEGRLCWPMNGLDALRATADGAASASAKCFAKDATLGMIGFSNGGYVANKLVNHCVRTPFKWLLSINAGGQADLSASAKAKDCGKLHLLVGTLDMQKDRAAKLSDALQRLGREVRYETFPGGHVVPEAGTRAAIKAFLKEPL